MSADSEVIIYLPYEMLRLIFLLVASLDRTSLSMEMVEMLSDLKWPSPLLKSQKERLWLIPCRLSHKYPLTVLDELWNKYKTPFLQKSDSVLVFTSRWLQAVSQEKCYGNRKWCSLLLVFSQAPPANRRPPRSGSQQNWTVPSGWACSWACLTERGAR